MQVGVVGESSVRVLRSGSKWTRTHCTPEIDGAGRSFGVMLTMVARAPHAATAQMTNKHNSSLQLAKCRLPACALTGTLLALEFS